MFNAYIHVYEINNIIDNISSDNNAKFHYKPSVQLSNVMKCIIYFFRILILEPAKQTRLRECKSGLDSNITHKHVVLCTCCRQLFMMLW